MRLTPVAFHKNVFSFDDAFLGWNRLNSFVLLGEPGHRNAAGCTLRGSWEEAEGTIVALLQDAVKRANGNADITEDALKG